MGSNPLATTPKASTLATDEFLLNVKVHLPLIIIADLTLLFMVFGFLALRGLHDMVF